ncbi:MAG: hypothetical protein ACT4QD_09760 [Acidobacteriota bacterium]
MTLSDHDHARELAAERWMRVLGDEERRWLDEHLAGCTPCAAELERLNDGLTAFRTVPVRADAALVRATMTSVRIYADRLHETQMRDRLLFVSSAVAGVCGALTLPWLWRAATFVADLAWLPNPTPVLLTVVLWTLPGAMAAALLAAYRRSKHSRSASPSARRQNGWETT